MRVHVNKMWRCYYEITVEKRKDENTHAIGFTYYNVIAPPVHNILKGWGL